MVILAALDGNRTSQEFRQSKVCLNTVMILKMHLANNVSQTIVIGGLNNIKYRIDRVKKIYT